MTARPIISPRPARPARRRSDLQARSASFRGGSSQAAHNAIEQRRSPTRTASPPRCAASAHRFRRWRDCSATSAGARRSVRRRSPTNRASRSVRITPRAGQRGRPGKRQRASLPRPAHGHRPAKRRARGRYRRRSRRRSSRRPAARSTRRSPAAEALLQLASTLGSSPEADALRERLRAPSTRAIGGPREVAETSLTRTRPLEVEYPSDALSKQDRR